MKGEGEERGRERERKGGGGRLVRAIRGKARAEKIAPRAGIAERMIRSALLYCKRAISAIGVRIETRNTGCNRIRMSSRKSLDNHRQIFYLRQINVIRTARRDRG